MMRVFITGARGLLGAAVAREFQDGEVIAPDRERLDVTDAGAVGEAVARARPDLIVNCAAYNNVDEAESRAAHALDVNAFAVLTLADAARRSGAILVHYSSDFVFDGETDRPYVEEDRPSPRSAYAASKLLGDWFALEAPRAYVLRVESLFGDPGPGGARRSSLATLVEGIRGGEEVPVFVDRVVSPSYTADVAAATRALVERGAEPGLYHCVNSGAGTWEEVARTIATRLGRPLRMRPLTLGTVTLVAPRPRYCALSPAKLGRAGIHMPSWQDAVARYLAQLDA
jgi:dTDP-4-dehydrorhamnose reductase